MEAPDEISKVGNEVSVGGFAALHEELTQLRTMATNQTHLATQEPAPERRRTPRVAPTLLTYVSFGGSNGGMVLDVSETGMALATALPMPEAQTLNIAIPSDQPHQLIEVRGTIVWISDSKRRVGVRLLDLSPASRDFLRRWVGTVLERKLSGAPEPVDNNFSYFSPASIVENCGPSPLRSELNEGKTSDDIDPLLDSFVAALRQKPQSRKSLLIMNAANAATNGRVPVGEVTEKVSAFPVTSEPTTDATPADVARSDEVLTTAVPEAPPAHEPPVIPDPQPAPSAKLSEQPIAQPPVFAEPTPAERTWLQPEEDEPVEDYVRIDFDEPSQADSADAAAAPESLFEPGRVAGVPVGMIDQHADVEPPARKIAESPVAPSEPKLQPRTTLPSMASRNISPFRVPLLLAACAIIVASFATGIGIGRSYWKRHASVTPNTARAAVAQQTQAPVTPAPATPPSITPAPKTSPPSALTPSQTSSGAGGANGATSSTTAHSSVSGSPTSAVPTLGKKDDASPAVTAATAGGILVTPGEGDTPLRVDLPEEAVFVSAPLEIRSQRFAYVPGTGTNRHGKVRKERLIIGELESPQTPQIPTPTVGTPPAQSGERIVTVRATIDGDGHVTYVDPLSGPIVLIPNVMTAVREWRYKPSSLDGQPVQTEADLTIKFRTTR